MQFRTRRVSRPVAAQSTCEKTPFHKVLLTPILLVLVVVAWTVVTSVAWSVVSSIAHADEAVPAAAVSIDNFTFGPTTLMVKAGTTVTWTNRDDIPHSVVDKNRKVFRSKVLDTGESFSFTFSNPGSYDYFCSLHPHMTGQIVVEP